MSLSVIDLIVNSIVTEKTIEDEYVDKNRELQSVLTEFVVNEFFPLEHDTEQFIKLVFGTFDEALKLYRQKMGIDRENQLFFVYKGGNILRYALYETMHEIGGKVSDEIEAYYKDVFKKSDADFSIYIDPHLKDYDIIFS